jgi:hypothetical protein
VGLRPALSPSIVTTWQTFLRLRHLWVDSAYQGSVTEWVEQTQGWTVEVVKRPSRWV